MSTSFKYFAFISYSQHDIRWGKRLERKLAGYKMPATMCSERGWERRPINPIFFAPYDIQPGDLDEELKARLRASRNLIVICSPSSAKSVWVGKEIRYFHELGRDKNIFFFIVDGEPHSKNPEKECFNPIIKELDIPEILGANIHEKIYKNPYLNRERAYVQLISKLLDVEFDGIWKRHQRQLIGQWIAYAMVALAFVGGVFITWQRNKDITVHVHSQEILVPNPYLPELKDLIVSLYVGEEKKIDTIHGRESIPLHHIPGRFKNRMVRLTVTHADFTPLFREVDTLIPLSGTLVIPILRDTNEYGKIDVQLIDKQSHKPLANTIALINNDSACSNEEGLISCSIPYANQKQTYTIYIPRYQVVDTIYMPAQDRGIIQINTKRK